MAITLFAYMPQWGHGKCTCTRFILRREIKLLALPYLITSPSNWGLSSFSDSPPKPLDTGKKKILPCRKLRQAEAFLRHSYLYRECIFNLAFAGVKKNTEIAVSGRQSSTSKTTPNFSLQNSQSPLLSPFLQQREWSGI